MFNDIKSHRLVSIQFLSAVNLFFGRDVQLSKDTITELYKNLSLRTLRGEQQIDFDKISNLTAHINFKMKVPSLPTWTIKTRPPNEQSNRKRYV